MQEHSTVLEHESLAFPLRISYFHIGEVPYISRKVPHQNLMHKIPEDKEAFWYS